MEEDFSFSQTYEALPSNNEENAENDAASILQLLADDVLSQEETENLVDDNAIFELFLEGFLRDDEEFDDDGYNVETHVFEEGYEQFLTTISPKSMKVYRKRLINYFIYCKEEEVEKNVVASLKTYVHYLRNTLKYCGSTIWSVASIIGSWFTIALDLKVIGANVILKKTLQNWEKQDKVKKSEVFTKENIDTYFRDFPDDEVHLVKKVIMIFAVYGLLRRQELTDLKFEDVVFGDDVVYTTFRRVKGDNKDSNYAITDSVSIALVKKYVNLYENGMNEGRFFRKLQVVKATQSKPLKLVPFKQPMGINTIGKVAGEIASFLKLVNADKFTAHGFRRSGATLLANAGISLPMLKIAGGWKSTTVAEGYIADCSTTKRKIGEMMDINNNSSTSSSSKQLESAKKSLASYNITAGNNAVFNFGENMNMNVNRDI